MKKIIFLWALMTAMISPVLAQGNNLSLDNEETGIESKRFFKHRLTQLKAEEDFSKYNQDALDIRWYDDPRGFFVYYTKEGKKGKNFYNKRGNFVYSSIAYSEQSLPLKIRKMIKSVYYMDFRITHVNEIRQDGKTVYLAMITDDKVWKKLRIAEDEMEVIKEYEAG